jgi:hypothetical protein
MANSDKNIRITGNRNTSTGIFPKIVFTGAAAGTSVVTLEVLDDNTVSFTSNEGQIFSLDSNLSTGTIWSVNDISGYPLLRADVGAASGATIRIAEGLGTVGIGETNPIHKFNIKGALAIGSTNTANYTVFRFPAAGSGQTYILPSAYPGTGTSILQSDTTGNLLWVAAAVGGGSGTTSLNVNVTQGVQNTSHRVIFTPATTTVAGAALSSDTVLSYNPSNGIVTATTFSGTLSGYASTGRNVDVQLATTNATHAVTFTPQLTAVIGSATSSDNTLVYNPSTKILTSSAIAITATTAAGSTSTGALTVAGGVGIGGSLWVGGPASIGGTLDYATTNMIANFTGNANGYTQVIVHNHNSGASASSDIIVSNDSATDTTFYGDFGMNSSGWASTTQGLASANAVYLAAASGDLVLGTFTANALRVTIGSSSVDSIYLNSAGTAISFNPNIDLRSAQSLRFLNSGNTAFTGLRAGANAANYTLTLPTAAPGTATSILVSDSTGAMAFVPLIGLGVSSFASNSAVSITHLEPFMVTFCSGYTPTAAGADSVVFRFPENVVDGSSSIAYSLRRVQMRVETLSAGTSTIRLEKYGWAAGVGTGAFSTTSTGSTANVMLVPLNIGGVGMGETFVTSASIGFSANGTSFVSGDKLRVNFTTLNATHANFTITALIDTVS